MAKGGRALEFLSMILFAFAVSLDGFGAGVAYGMRQIRIPLTSLLVICLASAVAISLSMFFGHFLGSFFSPVWAERIGSIILIAMGIWIIIQALQTQRSKTGKRELADSASEQIMIISIKMLGIVIQVLKQPEKADMDDSGVINAREAVILGFALAMDALGAGFGAAMTGFTPILTPIVVGIFKFLLVSLGLYIGASKINGKLGQRVAFLPGLVLILLGIL